MYNNQRSRQIIERDYTIGNHQSGPSNRFQIPTNGLLGEWLFNGGGEDSLGLNNLTPSNISYVDSSAGYTKQIASFNGSTSVMSNNSINLSITTIYTMAWNWNTGTLPTSGNIYNFFIKGNTTSSFNGFDCILYNNAGTYQVYMTHSTASAGTSYFWNITTPLVNTDYNYVITYGNNSISLYINGVLVSSQTATVAPTSATNNLYVGYNGIAGIRRFNGNMQYLRFYNRVLSNKEIQMFSKERLKLLH